MQVSKKPKMSERKKGAAAALFKDLGDAQQLQPFWIWAGKKPELQWCWREKDEAWWTGPIPPDDGPFMGFIGRALDKYKGEYDDLESGDVIKHMKEIGRKKTPTENKYDQQTQLDLMKGEPPVLIMEHYVYRESRI